MKDHALDVLWDREFNGEDIGQIFTYPSDHPLFNATQFKGGGILRLEICDRELYNYDLIPTRMAYRDNQLRLEPDSPMVYFLTRVWRWYNFLPRLPVLWEKPN